MEEMANLEIQNLTQAVESGRPVRLIFTTGYQCMAVVEDFDCNVIQCRISVKEHGETTERKWVVYRNGLSTIEFR